MFQPLKHAAKIRIFSKYANEKYVLNIKMQKTHLAKGATVLLKNSRTVNFN